MTDGRTKDVLLNALKQGMAEPGEQRLFRSGKLPGLFAGRTSVNGEAAAQALSDGFLEVVRTETKGKTVTEWVRVTQKGVDFLLSNESPVRAMDELQAALQATQEGIPGWMTEVRQTLQEMGTRLTEQVQSIVHRLETLSERVLEAMRRADAAVPHVPEGAANSTPWSLDAVGYLDRRREGGLISSCPLPELFASLREKHPELTIKDYHDGLRRLHDRGVFRLLPFEGPNELPEPEYALLDGAAVYYYVTR
jgi:hypothetical protein